MIAKMTCLCFVKIIIVNFRDSKTNDPDVHNWNSEIFQYLNCTSESDYIYLTTTYSTWYRTTLLNSDSLTHRRR